ncbi:ABC transporter transmembrane domain-containing protein [Sulfitobacter sp. D35]|uniref:ABC transporter transmembrane domain-containing protein n=1 Tax=Sulfitobacter sp. D35 TaxID=3083252 RepID=UPI00296F2705|nr:ABC transporter transmembrane domain-containing protein [Sulfitobacter sp. D35]MDW4498291.1 ABC transporter transmembrane domain-containing protein [Sulfitobacter sp. D35]
MEKTLFSFIWKYSRREQIFLLFFTVFTFPFLYATLELPKRIINDAIGSDSQIIRLPFGYDLTQTQFLMLLCFAYLGAVLVHGLLKMRLNTMKGILSERMLRRFRYTLISRMMRFPRSYYRNTSQGELVAMVTSEAEPMGGLMGDAVAQPVFQAGQMLIIVIFLFLQSVWFGLAGIALIPLQAYVIPILQRQINQLNKERIVEIRHFAAEIGETAAGITDLRTNAGWRYRLAAFTDRLGTLFRIRFQIYQKKFFMKFLNNFITQLTPFFFYAVGGYLAIRGDITVGALVAALAAYKDLSAPWRELLIYYNQVQDMSLRWDIVCERFAPKGMIDETLFEGTPEEMPHLNGPISIKDVTVRNEDGNPVLQNLNLEIPKGARVAIKSSSQAERTAFAELLTREVSPARGSVSFNGQNLSELHQAVIATRIGYAHSRPYLFDGTVGDNLLMSLKFNPTTVLWDPKTRKREAREARKSGNSADSIHADWVNPELAGLETEKEVRDWWFRLTETMRIDEVMFRRMLRSRINPDRHKELVERIVELRGEVRERLIEKGVDGVVNHFDPDSFNPSIPLGGNLLFAAPRREISQQGLVSEGKFLQLIAEQGLAEQGIAISQTVIETLHQTFGMDGTNHPLFTALGIEEELYERLVDIATRRREKGDQALDENEFALLLTVPFAFTAEQIGPAFPESFKREILEIRKDRGPSLRERTEDLFIPIAMDNYLPRLTVLENLLYGRISSVAGVQGEVVEDIVADVLVEHDLRNLVAETIWDIPAGLGGTNLPTVFQERVAFCRAGIKRPDVLILDQALASQDAGTIEETRGRLGDALPDTTMIFMEDRFETPEAYDLFIEIKNGRIDGVSESDAGDAGNGASHDLRRKLKVIARTELFADLDSRNQRLLAFSAQWFDVKAGTRIFSMGERPDAAYLCISGQAILGYRDDDGKPHEVTVVSPGRLIGDLAIILDDPRQLDLDAVEDSQFLRIGASEFRAVIQHDPTVLMILLKTVASHLTGAAELMREARIDIPQEAGPVRPPVEQDSV